VAEGQFAIAYLFEGEGLFSLDGSGDGELVQATRMLVYEDGDHIRVRAMSGSLARFMLMTGAPFKEPIVPYGPFVMNTQEEIRQTLIDLRSGSFGQN
jgi:redox-sensitive bicupin YhaK (pirin superfamily)